MYRPSSPLSTTMNASGLRSPSGRLPKPKQRSQNLHLPGLPRFHPANYQSSHSIDASAAITPSAPLDSPPSTSSPRQQQRNIAEAQRYLYGIARHTAAPLLSPPSTTSRKTSKPLSPRLLPLGSPGPVTPLELEEADGYMSSGLGSHTSPQAAKDELQRRLQEVVEAPPSRGDSLLHPRESGSKPKKSRRH